MTFKRNPALTAATLLCIATGASPALAQDSGREAFSGPYITVFGGASWADDGAGDSFVFDTDLDGEFGDTVNTSAGVNAFSPGFCDGAALTALAADGCDRDGKATDYGARFGYDGRIAGLVAGVLVEIDRNNVRESTSAFSTTPANYVITREVDYSLNARGRIGFALGDSFLVYGTGGVSYAQIDHRFATTNAANSFTQVNAREKVWGWQGGGGFEFAVARNVSLGAEYLYTAYDDDEYFVAVGPGTAGPTNPFRIVNPNGTNLRGSDTDFNIHTARATVTFRY